MGPRCYSQTSPPPSCAKYPHRTLSTLCGYPKCIAQFHTTMRCTFSQALQRSTTKVVAPCLFGHLPEVHRLTSKSDSQPTRSAPPTNFEQTSPKRCYAFHSTALGALGHSHRVAKVGSNAGDLSLVMMLGIRKDMVVLAFVGHCPADSTSWRSMTILSWHSSERSNGSFGWKPSTPSLVVALRETGNFSQGLQTEWDKDLPNCQLFLHLLTHLPMLKPLTKLIRFILAPSEASSSGVLNRVQASNCHQGNSALVGARVLERPERGGPAVRRAETVRRGPEFHRCD